LMDAWETGQQLAMRGGQRAVRYQVESSVGSEPYGYAWWRSQGALAYLGSEVLYPRESGSQGTKSTPNPESSSETDNGS
jgi:hypothetical protein